MNFQTQRMTLQAPRGMGIRPIADMLTSILQHRRVKRIEMLPSGEVHVDILLAPNESPEHIPDLPEQATPLELLRRMPRMGQVAFGENLPESVFAVYRQAVSDQYTPLGWLASRRPRLACAPNPHFMDRSDFELGGFPGYLADVPVGTLVLLCGMERDTGIQAANCAYRLQVPMNLLEAF